jgi:hypothetical protein
MRDAGVGEKFSLACLVLLEFKKRPALGRIAPQAKLVVAWACKPPH